jgi:hypothetical protein
MSLQHVVERLPVIELLNELFSVAFTPRGFNAFMSILNWKTQ